jgi:hypothetical protein
MDFSSIDWSNPATIGIIAGIVIVLAVGGYLYWAYSQQKWPFNRQ